MRRLATTVTTVVAAVVASMTLMTGAALASPGHEAEHSKGEHAKAEHAKAEHHDSDHRDSDYHRGHKDRVVTLTGVLSDTPTATIGSDTATATITMLVKRGERRSQATTVVLTLDAKTVVRRGQDHTAAALQKGDHLSVRAVRRPDGTWLALRVNAAPPRPKGTKDDD